MNRVIRPGVWLVFLFTGMSATTLACAKQSDGAVADHAGFAVNRAAALFCYAAILGTGTHTETSSSISAPDTLSVGDREASSRPALRPQRITSPHFPLSPKIAAPSARPV